MNIRIAHKLISVFGFRYFLEASRAIRREKRITIVTYHSITPDSYKHAITPRAFFNQLAFIKENYAIIKLNEIAKVFSDNAKMARKVVVTFDDAFENFYEFAYPTLQRLSIPCTIFVPSGLIGRHNVWDSDKGLSPKIQIMNKEQLIALSADGLVDFGSHTISHVSMRNLSPDEMRRQAIDSKKELEDFIGSEIHMFSYPHGQLDDVSKLTTKIVSEAGYKIAVTTRWGTLQTRHKILELKRIFFDEKDNHDNLRAKIEGQYDWFALKERVGFLLRSTRRRVGVN